MKSETYARLMSELVTCIKDEDERKCVIAWFHKYVHEFGVAQQEYSPVEPDAGYNRHARESLYMKMGENLAKFDVGIERFEPLNKESQTRILRVFVVYDPKEKIAAVPENKKAGPFEPA